MAEDVHATESAQVDFGALIDAFMPMAQSLLERDGFFAPFAAYLDAEGETKGMSLQSARGEEGRIDSPEEAMTTLEHALRDRAAEGQVQAAMILADIRFTGDDAPADEAVLGRFEHRDGSTLELVLPYEREPGNVEFREPSAGPGRAVGLTVRHH